MPGGMPFVYWCGAKPSLRTRLRLWLWRNVAWSNLWRLFQ